MRKHPIPEFLHEGLMCTVNSDDPAYFGGRYYYCDFITGDGIKLPYDAWSGTQQGLVLNLSRPDHRDFPVVIGQERNAFA